MHVQAGVVQRLAATAALSVEGAERMDVWMDPYNRRVVMRVPEPQPAADPALGN